MDMKKTIIFYAACVCAIIALFLAFPKVKHSGIPAKACAPVYNTMHVILDTDARMHNDAIILLNGYKYLSFPLLKDIMNKYLKGEVYSLDILIKKSNTNKVKNIIIFNDTKAHYFKDFSNFRKTEIQYCPDNVCDIYNQYTLPSSVKYNQNADAINYHSDINTYATFIFSLVSFPHLFSVPILLLFYVLMYITLIYFINNEEKIKPLKYGGYIIAVALFVCGFITYTNGIFDYAPWADEFYSIKFSDPNVGLNTIFNDPGNPPLFYLIFKIYLFFAGISTASIKLFPLIISFMFLGSIWWFLKKKFDLKIANIGLFLACINLPLVYYAQEARSYILQALLTPFIIYSLFKILEENKKKYYIIYGILVAAACNTHYFEILFIMANFVYALVYLIGNKRYKDLLKFILSNIIGAMFFLPFFLKTALNGALLDNDFNTWIPDINRSQILSCIGYVAGGAMSVIIASIFFIRNLFIKNKSRMLTYCFYVMFFTIFLGAAFSYMIRPLMLEKYLVLLCPVFIIFFCSCIQSIEKPKHTAILFFIWILFMQAGSFEKFNRVKGVIETPLTIAKQYHNVHPANKNIYAIINFNDPDYLYRKTNLADEDVKYVSSSSVEIKQTINNIFKKDKKAIIFTSMLMPNTVIEDKDSDTYKCFLNHATDLCLWKIEKNGTKPKKQRRYYF